MIEYGNRWKYLFYLYKEEKHQNINGWDDESFIFTSEILLAFSSPLCHESITSHTIIKHRLFFVNFDSLPERMCDFICQANAVPLVVFTKATNKTIKKSYTGNNSINREEITRDVNERLFACTLPSVLTI